MGVLKGLESTKDLQARWEGSHGAVATEANSCLFLFVFLHSAIIILDNGDCHESGMLSAKNHRT